MSSPAEPSNEEDKSKGDDHDPPPSSSSSGIRVIDTAAAVSSNNNDDANATTTTQMGSTTITGLPMDWTQLNPANDPDNNCGPEPPIRYPTDVSPELDVTDGEFVLVGTAGQKVTNLGPDFGQLLIKACETQSVPHMIKVILRSHLVREMQGLHQLSNLDLLELYDNQVQALVLTPNLATLTVLDMSYNAIRDMTPVEACPNLRELYLANNKLKAIAGLSGLGRLQKLDLGANRIRVMPPEELSGGACAQSLTELWLGKNKIEEIAGLSTFSKLRRLDLQSNRLRDLNCGESNGVEFAALASTLEELYLAHNGITDAGGGWLQHAYPELIVLDLSRNQLTEANSLGSATTFASLEELWLSGNQIAEWSAIDQVHNLATLETLYLEYNPLQTSDPLYRKTLAQMVPQLKQIDATLISATTTSAALMGTSGLVRSTGNAVPPVESEQDRMRRFQEMALQRAKQQQQQEENKTSSPADNNEIDSDDSGAENEQKPNSGPTAR